MTFDRKNEKLQQEKIFNRKNVMNQRERYLTKDTHEELRTKP